MKFFYLLRRSDATGQTDVLWAGDDPDEAHKAYQTALRDPAHDDCWLMVVTRHYGRYKLPADERRRGGDPDKG